MLPCYAVVATRDCLSRRTCVQLLENGVHCIAAANSLANAIARRLCAAFMRVIATSFVLQQSSPPALMVRVDFGSAHAKFL